jgi:uncharacterized protein (DUF2267 family)
MPHLTAQQATEQYKVSLRTLRTLISGLTAEQKAKHLLIKGKQHLISTELLNQHYQVRTGASVQNESAKRVQNEPKQVQRTNEPPTSHTPNDAKQVQNEVIKVQNDLIAHLQNEVAQLHQRLKEANFIAANLSRQQIAPPPPTDTPGPKPNTTTGEPFIWFVVGLVFGLFVVGLVIYSSY